MRISHVFASLLVVTSVLPLAACGSADKSSKATSGNRYISFLHFSQCMRSHGVPNFPDPDSGGGGIRIGPGLGLNPLSPAFQAAQQSCRKLLPGGGPHGSMSESAKLSLLHHAECMRSHGVSSYPDPIFPRGGGIESLILPSVTVNSPAFQRAAKACGGA